MSARPCPICEAPLAEPAPGAETLCARCGYRERAAGLDLAPEPVRLVAPPPQAHAEAAPVRGEAAPGWTCGHCQAETPEDQAACGSCGLPRHLPAHVGRPAPGVRDDRPVQLGPVSLPRPVFYLALGLVLALVVHSVMCGMFDFGVQVTVHEFGHAITAWAFGRPSIPIPVIGFTIWQEQSRLLVLLIWGALGWGIWRFRERKPLAATLAGLTLLYPLVAFTDAHLYVIAAMGHGSEVLGACACLWLALEGRARHQDAERVAAAMCAWLLLAGNFSLFLQLSTSRAAQHRYRNESVMGVDNDFVQVARALHMQLPTVCFLFVLLLLLATAATLGGWWFWRRKPAA